MEWEVMEWQSERREAGGADLLTARPILSLSCRKGPIGPLRGAGVFDAVAQHE